MDWTLKLGDQFSGTAKAAAAEMKGLERAMKSADYAAGKAAFVKGQRAAAAKAASEKEAKAAADSLKRAKDSVDSEMALTDTLKGAAGAMAGVAAAAGAVAIAVGAIAVKFAGAIMAGEDFARTTKGMFAAMSGGASDGSRELTAIEAIAAKTARPLEEVRTAYSSFASAGLGGKLLADVTAAQFDLSAMSEKGKQAAESIGEIAVKGKVGAAEFEKLAKVLGGKEAFGRAMGLTSKALESGADGAERLEAELALVNPKQFIAVALAAHKARSGIGDVAKQTATTGQLLASMKERAFLTIGKNVESGLVPMLDKLGAWMDSAEGKGVMGEISAGFNEVAAAVKVALPVALEFGRGMWGALKDIWPALKLIGKGLSAVFGGKSDMDGWMKLAYNCGYAVSAITVAVTAAVMAIPALVAQGMLIWAKLTGIFGEIRTAVGELATQAIQWGTDLVNGLVQGIQNGAGAAAEAAKGMAGQVKSAFTGALGISSPSRVFAQYGKFTVQGYAGGVAQNDNAATRATVGLAASAVAGPASVVDRIAPRPASVAMTARGVTRTGATCVFNFHPGAIVIQGATGDWEVELEQKLAGIFRRAIAGGGLSTEAA